MKNLKKIFYWGIYSAEGTGISFPDGRIPESFDATIIGVFPGHL